MRNVFIADRPAIAYQFSVTGVSDPESYIVRLNSQQLLIIGSDLSDGTSLRIMDGLQLPK